MKYKTPTLRRFAKSIAILALLHILGIHAHANLAHDQISGLSEQERKALFSKLLSGENPACTNVSRTFFRGSDKSDNAYWAAQCKSNKAFQIQISPNSKGSTKILDCSVAKALGIDCFGKFK